MNRFTKSRINSILSKFKSARILVIGDVVLDHFVWGSAVKISPEAPVPVVRIEKEDYRLGGAGNVLANLRSLGAKASLFSVIGEDIAGNKIVELIKNLGSDVNGIISCCGRPTIEKTRIIAHSQQVVRVDEEDTSKVPIETQNLMIRLLESSFSDFDAVIISDYNKGLIDKYFVDNIRYIFKSVPILVDPACGCVNKYNDIDVITPNDREAEDLSGIKIKDNSSLVECAKKLIELTGCSLVVITMGSKGMSYLEKDGKIKSISASAKEVYDVTGAGDTAISILSLGFASELKIEDSIYLSNFASGIVVGKIGTSVITENELFGFSYE
ncbi:MAG: bifunctional heptose 7-phosphate kinase/heptose 1-phosphate adenyltransferase [Candidatus Heimdallarchaeaceae archaeon]